MWTLNGATASPWTWSPFPLWTCIVFCAQIQFLHTEIFSSLCKITFPVNKILLMEHSLERTLSPAPIHFIPRPCVICAGFLLLFVLSSLWGWQEAKPCPSHLAHHGLSEAMKDVSASHPKWVLFISKAVARDGASSAGILARHLQTKFYSIA